MRADVKPSFADGLGLAPPAPVLPRPAASAGGPAAPSLAAHARRTIADFWLRSLFFVSERATWFARGMTGFVRWGAFRSSEKIRRATLANAARILGPGSTPAEREALAKGVLENFYRFCVDVGRSAKLSRDQLLAEISGVDGTEHYLAARTAGAGLVVVTAHMGSFEVGLAELTTRPGSVHVIFRRDAQGGFERQRSSLRRRLGVCEAPVDDGWTMWMRLRDALAAGDTVVFQGDRVMPGQRGRSVPFLHGHVELPTGPVKLSRLSGAAILPVFTVREPGGKIRVCIEPPIVPTEHPDSSNGGGEDPMLLAVGAAVEKFVRAYPEQWLMFEPAFIEDRQR
ncbi:MAG: putative acyltransferase [Phycisphaerales bacterium]|nr:putative acyltransferase [Phycisphaerales bacterium]